MRVCGGAASGGGLTERLLVATASTYAISPRALGDAGAGSPRGRVDWLSAGYLVALGALAWCARPPT